MVFHTDIYIRGPTNNFKWLRRKRSAIVLYLTLHTGMTTLACILSELFPLDCLSCNALYFENHQDYFHDTVRLSWRGRDNVWCIKNMAALMSIPLVRSSPLPPPHTHQIKRKKNHWIWILCQNSLTRELKIKFVRLALYSPTCIKQAPKGQSKSAWLRQVLA